jgi:hypothetical protein
MPLKDVAKRKKYHAQYMKEIWYPKNKKKHLRYVKRNKKRVSDFIEQYKRKSVCADCGFSGKEFPYVLDFDHKNNGSSKEFTIGSWAHSVLSITAIQKEIEKCEVVCANCHRIRTFASKRKG